MANQSEPAWWPHHSKSWDELSDYFNHNVIVNQQQWQKISYGVSNNNYQLTINHKRYFVQLVNDKNLSLLPQANHYPDLTQLTIFRQLKPWLATALLQTSFVRIFEWVDSAMVGFETSSCASYQQSFLTFITILHSEKNTQRSAISNLPTLNISEHLSHYQQLVLIRYSGNHELLSQVNIAVDRAKTLSLEFSATTFCHNDLSLSNQLWNKKTQQLTILDWEYACFSDPIFELANYFNALQLNNAEQLSFLKKYQASLNVKVDLNKLKNMQELAKIINYLWDLVAN